MRLVKPPQPLRTRVRYNNNMTKFHRTYQHRAYTSRAGYERIAEVLRESARLYNAALEEWHWAYRAGVSVTLYSQYRELTAIRAEDAFWGNVSIHVGRGVLRRADRARKAFFRRVKAGEKPGYPRFKSSRRWHTVEIANVTPGMVRDRGNYYAIRIKGLPEIRLRKGLALPEGDLKALSITLRGRRLFVNMTYEVEQAVLPKSDAAVGIDMGVSDRLALSTGETVKRRRKRNRQLERAQRRLSSCRKGSHRWRQRRAVLANHQHRERVRNRNECHRITTDLVRRFGLIAVEDLAIRNMTASAKGTAEEPGTNVSQKRGLNRSITEQTWGMIRHQLTYKAGWAGREMVVVDPKFTSQRCSGCGVVAAENRKSKQYQCATCGMTEDADVNAALNILHKALAGRREPCNRIPAAGTDSQKLHSPELLVETAV